MTNFGILFPNLETITDLAEMSQGSVQSHCPIGMDLL